ncbi:hypothetical protein G7072_01825 [Nocardioides sp. HDW12B]|uniref:hypothetical protein n=1 Tax=Nocardioides sp. HDW12B TaxID=2714939 RepID=UPI00140AA4A6|nr:hypothetical protein [Nocardioides sp. HDW12B]QIK65242.1 hypothetical protein G7072_01825 [Nocardioides sp. HDW12B]
MTAATAALVAGVGALGVTTHAPPAAASTGAREELRFLDPAIDESSGLVVQGDDVLTVNDSGDGPVVYVVDAGTGETVGRTTYTSDEVVDVEALARGRDGSVWVGDIGDNDAVRPFVSLYRLPAVTRGDRTVTAQRFDLVHPGGPRDAETLLVQPSTGRVFVVTKGVFGGQVMAAPDPLRAGQPNRLRPVGRVGGLVTDGTFLPGGAVVLRDYGDGFVVDPRTWRGVGAFPMPLQEQAEAVAPWPGGRVLVSSEGDEQPLLSVPVPQQFLDEATREGDGAGGSEARGQGRDGPSTRTDDDEPAQSVIPLGPAVVGGGVLALATLTVFWLLRRRVRRTPR